MHLRCGGRLEKGSPIILHTCMREGIPSTFIAFAEKWLSRQDIPEPWLPSLPSNLDVAFSDCVTLWTVGKHQLLHLETGMSKVWYRPQCWRDGLSPGLCCRQVYADQFGSACFDNMSRKRSRL